MSEWIHDRAPREDEIKDNEVTYITVHKDALGVVSRFVTRMSGFKIRCYFGEMYEFTKTIIAWLPMPEPWDEDKEAAEAAKLYAAMVHGDNAKLRECLKDE